MENIGAEGESRRINHSNWTGYGPWPRGELSGDCKIKIIMSAHYRFGQWTGADSARPNYQLNFIYNGEMGFADSGN